MSLSTRWKWIGHIFKSEDELVQDVPEWRSQGSRGCGRPRKTWLREREREIKYISLLLRRLILV